MKNNSKIMYTYPNETQTLTVFLIHIHLLLYIKHDIKKERDIFIFSLWDLKNYMKKFEHVAYFLWKLMCSSSELLLYVHIDIFFSKKKSKICKLSFKPTHSYYYK